jgi:hypothetical protein
VSSLKDVKTLKEAVDTLKETVEHSTLTQKSLFWTAVFTPLLYFL